MTYQQMYDLGGTFLDKAGSPYFPEAEFDSIINAKYDDLVTQECRRLEQDQYTSTVIHGLYRPFTKVNSSVIILPTEIPTFRYLFRFKMKYRLVCGMKTTYPEVPIFKAQNDDIDIMQNDPFNKATNAEPLYIFSVNSANQRIFQVFSADTPLEISMTYVKNPAPVNSATDPTGVFELQDFVARQLVRAAVMREDIIIENLQRGQAEAAEQQAIR